MIAPGPMSCAPSLEICAATSSLDVPLVTVSVFPSMKMLSFLAIVRVAFCAWASAKLDTLDDRAIVVATMIARLHVDPLIHCSCQVASFFWLKYHFDPVGKKRF